MIVKKLRDYLDDKGVSYVHINHSVAYTTREVAHFVQVHEKEMAKTVMVNIEGDSAMVVLPGSYVINFQQLCHELNTTNVYLETESDFQNIFSDCETGAMPPFGNLYGIDVYVLNRLAEDKEITFNAGTHTDLIRMAYKDFARLVKPKILNFSVPILPRPNLEIYV
jgi:Ala-tRNA(Pro) deacylase